MVNAACMDIEREAEQLFAHDGAFKMPAGCALAPWTVPFHLPRLARRGLAPDREVGGIAFAFHRIDPAFTLLGNGTRKTPVIRHGGDIEIEAAFEFVAVLLGNALGERQHLLDIVRGDGPVRGLADVQRLHVVPIGLGIVPRDIPDGLRTLCCGFLQLVLTRIGIVRQVAHIGDVDDMGELVALPGQRAAQHVRKHVGAHVADMRIVIDRGSAGIDARLAGVDGHERLDLPSQ